MRRRREWNEARGRYELSVELPRDPATGKRRQKRIVGKDWDAVQAKRDKIIADNAAGRYVDPAALTVTAYLARWLESIDVRANTKASYERTIRDRITPHIGGRKLQQLTTAELSALYAQLAKTGSIKGGALSPRSVAYAATILGRALEDAEREGLIGRNPARAARKPKARQARRDMVVWTPQELNVFLSLTLDVARDHALFRVLGLCGLRRSEALGLTWADVDFDDGELAVRRSLTLEAGQFAVAEPKTTRGRRTVDVDAETLAALRTWRAAQGEMRLRVGVGWQDIYGGLVFTRPDGRPLRPNSVGQTFDALVAKSGLPRIRLHDLRHGHASHLLSAGAHPALVSARLGHASAGFTLGVYAHVMPGQQKDAADAVAKLVGGGAS